MFELRTLGVGVALFVSTNIDDILLLAAFFADPRLRVRAIVAGQFAGIAALTALSAAAALAAIVIPEAWIALLGVVPLWLGLRQLWLLRAGDDDGDDDGPSMDEQAYERRTHSQLLAVAAVTVANGGDNLGVYIPVFAADVQAIPAYAAVFAVMTAVWCAAGHALVNNGLVGRHLRRYGHIGLPFVLIGLGVMILRGAAPLVR